jgi:hypothetical protein
MLKASCDIIFPFVVMRAFRNHSSLLAQNPTVNNRKARERHLPFPRKGPTKKYHESR